MSACFNAVVRAPLPALLIVFEMTHQFSMVPALMFCSIVSQAIVRLGGKHNFYDALLLQDGHDLIRIKPPRDLESWQKLPASEIARTRPLTMPDVQSKTMESYLASYPYQRFPVITGGKVRGIVTREDSTLRELRSPPHATGGMPAVPQRPGGGHATDRKRFRDRAGAG